MLMVGASFLQLNKVRDACAEFLISRFHAYNVLGIRQFADSLSCAQLVTAAEKYIHLYFAKVALSDEFLNLSEFMFVGENPQNYCLFDGLFAQVSKN